MKKRLMAMLLLAAMAVTMMACGNENAGDNNQKEVNAAELAQALATQITYTGKMEQLKEDDIEWYIELEEGVTGIVYEVAGVSSEQVAVFTVPNKEAADKTIASIEELLADQKDQNAAYDSKVTSRIENAVITYKGNYVILCVSDDSAKANRIIKDAFGE
ncbi:MAG: DUF4358 domain-containing protein [Agathobacter sp.]